MFILLIKLFLCVAIFIGLFFIINKYNATLKGAKQIKHPWKESLHEIASNHTQVNGVLAGFSFTVVILISSIRLSNPEKLPDSFFCKSLLSLFILSFFGYVVAGILYSLVVKHKRNNQQFIFSIASVIYYFSVVISFSALLPLLKLLNYANLYKVVDVMIVGAILGGFITVCVPYYDLLGIIKPILIVIFPVSLLISILFINIINIDIIISKLISIFNSSIIYCACLLSITFIPCVLSFFFNFFNNNKVRCLLSIIQFIIFTASILYMTYIVRITLTLPIKNGA